MKYRKKPVVIEAYQWFPRRVTDKNYRNGVGMLYKDVYMENTTEDGKPIFVIDTLEGKYIDTPVDKQTLPNHLTFVRSICYTESTA